MAALAALPDAKPDLMDGAQRSQNRELNLYIRGWLNYKLSSTYSEVLKLSQWIRRRVRLYDWKQWSRSEAETASHRVPGGRAKPGNQPRTRRCNLLEL